jgi:hypothetical protein
VSKTIFIGCSHSHGYTDHNSWGENNYAELYADEYNKEVVIYSQPGASNRKYPSWIKLMLDRYADIEEIFVQSTYLNRFLINVANNLDGGLDHQRLDIFSRKIHCSELIDRYTDGVVANEYMLMELNERLPNSEFNEKYNGVKINEIGHADRDFWKKNSYAYVKLYHELLTPLQYREYCLDLLAIDTMCTKRNIKWYIWNINDRTIIPDNIDLYTNLNCIRAPMSAQTYIKKYFDMDIDDHTVDGEHYNTEVHKLIATNYIKYLTKT